MREYIFWIGLFGQCYGTLFDTNISAQFQNQPIVCANGAPCHIRCDEQDACKGSAIHCPMDSDCTVICLSNLDPMKTEVCKDSTIYCPVDSQCNVACFGAFGPAEPCYDIDIHWPTNTSYINLTFNEIGYGWFGQYGVRYPPLPLIDDYTDFSLTCGTQYPSCRGIFIICPKFAECNVLCTNMGQACGNTEITCPINASCNVECNMDFGCSGLTIFNEADNIATLTCTGTNACFGVRGQFLPTPSPTAHPSISPSNNPTTSAPTTNPSSSPTDPSTAPTFPPSKDPTVSPTRNPTKYPSSSPTLPSNQPTKYPTTNPSTHPSSSPSLLPSSNPSSFPTDPSTAPTFPTRNPTKYPTFPPSNDPTTAPIAAICGNDADLLVPSVVMDHANALRAIANNGSYRYENIANSHIMCDNNDDLYMCIIHCVEYEGCIGSKVIIEGRELSQVVIDCNASFACTEVSVQITDSAVDSISILCAAEQSCDGMVIDINVGSPIQVNTLCVADNACDNLAIIGDSNAEHININLTVTKYSSDISIQYPYIDNIDVSCKSAEKKFIQQNTDALTNPAAMKRNVRRQYTANRMPCEDVSILCTESAECEFAYSLSSKFNISHILRAKEYTDCLWVDINDIYDVNCDGDCTLAPVQSRSYTHDILFYVDITFQDNNGTDLETPAMKPICDKHFNVINTTKDSVQSIDVIFIGVVAVLKATDSAYDIINELTILPITQLRNDLMYLECNSMENPLKLATELSVSSEVNDKELIHALLSGESPFVIESEALIQDLFATKLRINITIIDVFIPSDDTGIPEEIVVSSTGGLICVIIILLCSILYCNKRRKMQREAETMYILNPMVIGISIGKYNDPIPNDSEIDGCLGPLDGIDEDMRNVVRLYRDVLNYDGIFPQYNGYNDDDEIKQHWTKDEIVKLLNDKAKELSASLDTYDGLVVVLSSHGLDNSIISSDYKKLDKVDIHRVFSVDYPDVRDIPRCFIFDCCDGSEERGAPREYINADKREAQNEKAKKGKKGSAAGVDKGKAALDKGLSVDVDTVVEETHSGTMPSFTAQNSTKWAHDESNPDYKLVVINAANKGFQSKMSTVKGSYCIRKLTEKMMNNISNNENQQFLTEIMDEVQTELHNDGKQLIDATYNNKTGYIKFRKHNNATSSGLDTELQK